MRTTALIKDTEIDSMLSADAVREIAAVRTQAGDVKGATTWAAGQAAPAVRALALTGVAEGLLNRARIGAPRTPKTGGWWDPPES